VATKTLYTPTGTTWTSALGEVVNELGTIIQWTEQARNAVRLGELYTSQQSTSLGAGLEPFGLCSHQNEASHYAKWVEAGVQWIRFDIPWDELEPTQGTYLWSGWDTAISTANTLGLKVLLVLGYVPTWANGGNSHNYSPLVAFDPQWSAYVAAVTARYGTQVSAWEIWNEPDLDNFHHAHTGDWAYTNYAGYTTTDKNRIQYKHAVDLAMQAGVAGKYCTTSGYAEGGGQDAGMRQWLIDRRGWFDQFDAASYHCYGWLSGTAQGSYDRLQNVPNDYRVAQDGAGFEWPGGHWITEHGITSGSNPTTDDKMFLIRSYALALSQSRVKKLFWFRGGYDPNHRDMLDNSSVRTAIFYAYQTLTSFWGTALTVARWSSGNAQGAIATLLNGTRTAIVWQHDDQGAGMRLNQLGLLISACYDQDGASISAASTLTAHPVFVQLSD
jgi:hypothetical protein